MRTGARRAWRMVALGGVVLIATIATGCGGGNESVLGAAQQERLLAQVSDARAAAGQDDRAAARSALGELEREVRRLASDGVLDERQAAALLASVERAAARVDRELSPPPAQEPGRAPAPERRGAAGAPRQGDEVADEDEDEDEQGRQKKDEKEGKREKEGEREKEGKREKDDEDKDGD